MSEETWRPLAGYGPGYEARYEISNQGRIRSIDRWVPRGALPDGLVKGRVLRTRVNSRGYESLRLTLTPAYTSKNVMVHIAVLSSFVGPRPAGAVARHLDGNTANNTVANLAWGSQSENLRDRRHHGTDPHVNKTHCPSGHPYDAANTYEYTTREGWSRRGCRACNRASVARYQSRKRTKQVPA